MILIHREVARQNASTDTWHRCRREKEGDGRQCGRQGPSLTRLKLYQVCSRDANNLILRYLFSSLSSTILFLMYALIVSLHFVSFFPSSPHPSLFRCLALLRAASSVRQACLHHLHRVPAPLPQFLLLFFFVFSASFVDSVWFHHHVCFLHVCCLDRVQKLVILLSILVGQVVVLSRPVRCGNSRAYLQIHHNRDYLGSLCKSAVCNHARTLYLSINR